MAERKRVPLLGSERRAMPGATRIGPANPDERVDITIVLRRRGPAPKTRSARAPHSLAPHLTRATLAANHGALPDDVAQIRTFAEEHGLAVKEVDVAARTVKLSGTVRDLSAAFQVTLDRFEHSRRNFRGRTGPILVPANLEPIIEAVLGLDDRPHMKPNFRSQAGAGLVAFTPPQVAGMYNFPDGLDGSGQTIGIIELGGGFHRRDLNSYFDNLGLDTPSVTAVGVGDGSNDPTDDPDSADREVMLDIEVAGAVAPGADIRVYFGTNSDEGFLGAVNAAIHDEDHPVTVISISWADSEIGCTAQFMSAMDDAFIDAGALGITVCTSAGDDGSTDGNDDDRQHVEFPSSSPNVLACGGTTLVSSDGVTISDEFVWNNTSGATGGGVSETFPKPDYQVGVGVPHSKNPGHFVGRGVPDVAGDADPETGYTVRVDGTNAVVAGTSATAPLWAGLIALINQYLGPPSVGFLNPLLYADPNLQQTFSDITQGDNGAFDADAGWDACTGWGSPNGALLLDALWLWRVAQMDQ